MRAAQLDPWLRDNPPVLEWKLNWPAFSVDPDHPICAAVGDAHEIAAAGTRFAGRPEVHGFAAVEDATFLNLGGMPAISYGPGRPARRPRRRRVLPDRRAGHVLQDVRGARHGLVRRRGRLSGRLGRLRPPRSGATAPRSPQPGERHGAAVPGRRARQLLHARRVRRRRAPSRGRRRARRGLGGGPAPSPGARARPRDGARADAGGTDRRSARRHRGSLLRPLRQGRLGRAGRRRRQARLPQQAVLREPRVGPPDRGCRRAARGAARPRHRRRAVRAADGEAACRRYATERTGSRCTMPTASA